MLRAREEQFKLGFELCSDLKELRILWQLGRERVRVPNGKLIDLTLLSFQLPNREII